MQTTLYLIRHAATPANLQKPAKLQGCGIDTDLAPIGIRQATATRDFLALQPIEFIYSSPLKRALQTARIIAEPHGLAPVGVPELTECDVGVWEGRSWEEIKQAEPEEYARYHSDPALHGYRGGENFRQVHDRATHAIDEILARHEGATIAVVSHHVVNRTYLAGVLGLGPARARAVSLDNCGISVLRRRHGKTTVAMLNTSFHLQGVAA
ncbi:MAG TPA: histidine phosphatase family protein [Gemmataceae bacterium]|jgi:broad specificity phosphatase PhoE|nr:histidine phosphatase family protein [Gemmataceae bacterium]